MIRKILLALCVIPALVAGMPHVPAAFGQSVSNDQAGVGIQPLDTKPSDPNGGQWFFREGLPGQTLDFRARVVNLATVERTVKMYLADLSFSSDGTPQIPKRPQDSKDIGTWGGDVRTLTLKPNAAENVSFQVHVPDGADPGDHVGVVVIENPPVQTPGQAFGIIKRVSTRLYVTVPGDAKPAMKIESVKIEPDSSFFPREATVRVTLRNTGTIGLRPTVLVNGEKAGGPEVMLTKSIENFVVTKKVPIYGGPQSYRIDVNSLVGVTLAQNRIGPVESVSVSRFYFPWVLLIALAVLTVLVLLVRRWLRRRSGKYAAMRADMKRIERLLSEQRANGGEEPSEDPELAIKAAIKRAGRAGDKDAEEKLKEKLAEHRAAQVPAPAPEPPLVAEPAPAASAAPVASSEPEPAPSDSSSYDFLREPVAPSAEADPKNFYDSLRETAAPAAPAPEPPRVPVQTPMGPGYFVPDPAVPVPEEESVEPNAQPAPAHDPVAAASDSTAGQSAVVANGADDAPAGPGQDRDEALAAVLRELSTAPKRRQDALIKTARSYGVLTLRAHADLVAQLPADVRAKLMPRQVI